MLQYLDEESEVEEEEKEIEYQEDIENEIFEDVTLEERKLFYIRLYKLRSHNSHSWRMKTLRKLTSFYHNISRRNMELEQTGCSEKRRVLVTK